MTTKLRLLTVVLTVPAAAALAPAQTGTPPVQSVPFNGSAVPPISPVPPVGSPVGIGSYPALPTSPTLWSFLGLSNAQREFRQRAAADTPFGELRSKIRQPLSDATGGLIPPVPPGFPSLAELQDPGPVGAAAKVKLDRLAAKKRIKAVQYLGTVDCHYWPEAEDALVNGLRADRNEWVRLAAAQTLLRGCCCTKKTILALTMAATCSNADGNPAEKSPRVVCAAQAALAKCLESLCCSPVILADAVIDPTVPPPVGPADGGPAPAGPAVTPPPKGERAPMAAVAKPGPAGVEKGPGGLASDQMAVPSTREIYDRAAGRPWGEMIAFSRAHLAKAPSVPAEYLSEALAELAAEAADDAPVMQASTHTRPANLYDALFSDTNTAKVSPPRPQPAVAPTLTAMAPARLVPLVPMPAPVKLAPLVPASAPVAVAKPAEPARVAISVPPQPAPVFTPAVKQATMTSVARVGLSPAAGKLMTALDANSGVEAAADVLTPADVSVNGPVLSALLKTAEDHKVPAVRSACVRALARCKARTPSVLAGLERLVNDRNVDVRVEAAVALNDLKAK